MGPHVTAAAPPAAMGAPALRHRHRGPRADFRSRVSAYGVRGPYKTAVRTRTALPGDMTPGERRDARKRKNVEASKELRDRKKGYVSSLTGLAAALELEVAALERQHRALCAGLAAAAPGPPHTLAQPPPPPAEAPAGGDGICSAEPAVFDFPLSLQLTISPSPTSRPHSTTAPLQLIAIIVIMLLRQRLSKARIFRRGTARHRRSAAPRRPHSRPSAWTQVQLRRCRARDWPPDPGLSTLMAAMMARNSQTPR